MLAASATSEKYRCPGEEYDITHSVHLARLAAGYAKCWNCQHAPDAPTANASSEFQRPFVPDPRDHSLFTKEGIRGRYLNELTRGTAAKIAGAMASGLWEVFAQLDREPPESRIPRMPALPLSEQADRLALDVVEVDAQHFDTRPLSPSSPSGQPKTTFPMNSDSLRSIEGVCLLALGRPGPIVVLGHDERPSSPDIVTGVGQTLRRMGCQVIDIGLVTRPCLAYAIDHLGAAGGAHVTGAGCDPGWAGLDLFTRGNIPCSTPGELDCVAARYLQGYSRPSRRPGFQRTFQAVVPYEASLLKHFHALRPLKIALACPSRTVREFFARIFRKLACRLFFIETPTRQRNLLNPSDPDIERTSRQVCETRADLGVLIEDDGEQCTFFDERGGLVAPQLMGQLLAIVQGRSLAPEKLSMSSASQDVLGSLPTRESMTLAMHHHQSSFAADGAGRYWFAEAYPTCDALLTLVYVLQALSRSDTPFSEVMRLPG